MTDGAVGNLVSGDESSAVRVDRRRPVDVRKVEDRAGRRGRRAERPLVTRRLGSARDLEVQGLRQRLVAGRELSRLISVQPLGAVIAALPGRRALTDATSTSPAAAVEGRLIVRAVPHVEAVLTAEPEGRALSAGDAPEMVAPRSSASARTGMYWRKRRTTDRVVMSPLWSGRAWRHSLCSPAELERRVAAGHRTRPHPPAGLWLWACEGCLLHHRSANSCFERARISANSGIFGAGHGSENDPGAPRLL